MTRGQVAQLLGIHPETVRYYEKIGLIEPEFNPYNCYRHYDGKLVEKLELIILLKRFGFSLKEIGSFFAQLSRALEEPERTDRLLDRKILEIDRQLNDLKALRQALSGFRDRTDSESCRIFARFISNP